MSEAQVLNKSQRLKSISASAKKRSLKTLLCTPYNPVWPNIESTKQKQILKLLEQLCSTTTKTSQQLEISTAESEKKENDSMVISTSKGNRRNEILLLGINKVTRSLDRDELCLMIVDRSAPWQLHRHLITLSAVRQCPAAAVEGLAALLCPLLQVTRLAAVGFKKLDVTNHLETDTINSIVELVPEVTLPWLQFTESLLSNDHNMGSSELCPSSAISNDCDNDHMQSEEPSTCRVYEDNSSEQSEVQETILSSVFDSNSKTNNSVNVEGKVMCSSDHSYSHLYVYKKVDSNLRKNSFIEDFVELPAADSDSDDEERSLWNFDPVMNSSCRTPDRRSSNVKTLKRVSTPSSNYKRINIGKMQGKERPVQKKKKNKKL